LSYVHQTRADPVRKAELARLLNKRSQWGTERTGYSVGKTEREPNKRLAAIHM